MKSTILFAIAMLFAVSAAADKTETAEKPAPTPIEKTKAEEKKEEKKEVKKASFEQRKAYNRVMKEIEKDMPAIRVTSADLLSNLGFIWLRLLFVWVCSMPKNLIPETGDRAKARTRAESTINPVKLADPFPVCSLWCLDLTYAHPVSPSSHASVQYPTRTTGSVWWSARGASSPASEQGIQTANIGIDFNAPGRRS